MITWNLRDACGIRPDDPVVRRLDFDEPVTRRESASRLRKPVSVYERLLGGPRIASGVSKPPLGPRPTSVTVPRSRPAPRPVRRAPICPIQKTAPRRVESIFIENSAVESDGEGGDVESRCSTPDPSEVLPVELPVSEPVEQHASPEPVKKKDHSVRCDLCCLLLVNDRQLPSHRQSKRCRQRILRNLPRRCRTCDRVFDTHHDLVKHQQCKKHS